MSQLTIDQALQIALGHHRAGRLPDAEHVYRQIIGAAPRQADALHLLGLLLHQRGQSAVGYDLIQQAIAVNPNCGHYHSNRGEILRQTGQIDQAITAFSRAIELDPNLADAHSNLANLLCGVGRFDEAIVFSRRAIAIDPRHAEAHVNLGSALHEAGRLEEAAASHRGAIEIRPDYAKAHSNLATVLFDLGRVDEALQSGHRAVQVKPDYAAGHWNLGLISLAAGDFVRGWAECEWRWRVLNFPGGRRDFRQPLWTGSDIAGKTILVHAEQGFGDVLQMCRYVPLLAERGARMVLECQSELARLLGTLAGVSYLVTKGDSLPPFDVHVPMMSLPKAFGTTPETIPAAIPYLRADRQAAARWRERIGGEPGLKVALAWAGRPTHENNRNRSIALSVLAPLADVPAVRFFSVQKGDAAQQAKSPPPGMGLIECGAELNDFADTAALIANMDLVLTVDTAVAHLAGSMGKPVWVMVPFAPDWRWMLRREDSPWYRTARLFRQPAPFDWAPVIQRVRQEMINVMPAEEREA